MKKIVIIVVTVLFFLLLLAAVVFKLFVPTSPSTQNTSLPSNLPPPTASTGADSQSPTQFVAAFYHWYLVNADQNSLYSDPSGEQAALAPWLTTDFRQNLDEYALAAEANPILLTAEDTSSWGTNISTRIVSQSVRTAVVYAAISSPTEVHTFNVTILRGTADGAWKISAITNAD